MSTTVLNITCFVNEHEASDLDNSKAWEDELNNRISIEPTKRGHSMDERSEDYVEEVEYFYGS